MKNLIRYDLRRILKDKLVIIVTICMVALEIGVSGIFIAAFRYSAGNAIMQSKDLIFFVYSSFNYGITFMEIMLLIILSKEYTQGTIRNKIVAGYSKSEIYFSNLLTTVICCFSIFLFAFIINFVFCVSLNGFGEVNNIGTYLLKHFSQMIYILFLIVLVHFLSSTFKSIGAPLGIMIGLCIGLPNILLMLSPLSQINETAYYILMIFPQHHNVMSSLGPIMGFASFIETQQYLYYILIELGYIALMIFGGVTKYRKSDFK
ncbi:MAG: ABC transporter permease [Bacteroidales bacterium]|jgi:ABC-type transport system involved in multi-copper enzyme maturation permease subunit|nr:ABC transporter permease [Bacteroidales bacterium]